ncbi:MAG TPA: hypothetical protein VGX70_17250 [Gemmataceae bacterium]|nr:hypothetical protein [Gemmataceae bacterium]
MVESSNNILVERDGYFQSGNRPGSTDSTLKTFGPCNGLESEGLRWLESALVEDPRHAPTHRALTDFYARAGDKEKAELHRRMMNK